jgi:tripartite-type tricarboxylate transporter receptor subunit TctC
MVVNPHLFKHVKVDPLKAFEPVTLITSAPLALVVPTKSPFKTVEEFLAFVRANPNKLSYGSAGNGSASHLATVLLARLGKFEATHVPYRGAGPALNDLVSGQTDFMVTTMPSVVGLVSGGAVRALGVSTEERVERFPDLPTLGESVPGYATGAWYGFVTPKGTPPEVNAKLREATVAAINTQVVRERFAAEGAKPIGSTPEAFQKMMADESKRWAEIIAGTSIVVN